MNDVSQSIEKVRSTQEPHFMITSCYRTMEHVGVDFDWELGYRDSKELDEWSQYDIETDPELWQLEQDFVDRESIKAKDKVEEYFQQAVANPEEPSEDSIFNFVY